MDQTDFANTMLTLGMSPIMAKGFEQEGYGAALLLVHYQDNLTPAGRQMYARALIEAGHKGQTGIQHSFYGQFFWQLNQLRLQTFFSTVDDDSVQHRPGLISSPWALIDKQFAYCIFTLRQGKDPDPAKFEKMYLTGEARIIADKVEKKLLSEAVKFLEKIAIEGGGTAIGMLLKAKNSTIGGVVFDVLKDWLLKAIADYSRAELLRRYEVDERRRLYLASMGLSKYQRVDAPDL